MTHPTEDTAIRVALESLIRHGLERLHREIQRRTRVASLFPNEASLMRLASAILVEIDEEWQTGKVYLNLKSD